MSNQITQIHTTDAPDAIGPYSQAISVGNMLFTSGQIPVSPTDGTIVGSDIETQARQAFENLKAVLEAGGASLSDVVKVTVFVKDLGDFAKLNDIYATYFSVPYPSRSCVEVARLPKDVLVEIEAVAVLS